MPALSDERSDPTKDREVISLRATQWKELEEREHPLLEIDGPGHFEVVNPVPTVTHRSDVEGRTEELWELTSDLRHVERQRDAPRQATITLSTAPTRRRARGR